MLPSSDACRKPAVSCSSPSGWQTSPIPFRSPSAWPGFAIVGQLSSSSGTPSRSESAGAGGAAGGGGTSINTAESTFVSRASPTSKRSVTAVPCRSDGIANDEQTRWVIVEDEIWYSSEPRMFTPISLRAPAS